MKKNKFLKLFLILVLMSSCSDKQPKCNSNDVKEILFSIVKENLQLEYEEMYFEENWNFYDLRSYALDNGLDVSNFIDEKKLELKKEAVIEVEKIIRNTKIELSEVRILEKNEEIKKCECAAEMIIDREFSKEIEYTAQFTEDGKIYVELKN